MKLSLFFFLVLWSGVAFAQPDSLFEELNVKIDQRDIYVSEKVTRIQKLKTRLNQLQTTDHVGRFDILRLLTEEYKSFIYDSAFHYVRKMQATSYLLHDPIKIAYSKNQLGFVLLSSGLFKETLDSMQQMRVEKMPDSIKRDYYSILGRAYYDLGDFDNDQYYTPQYTFLGNNYLDSAIALWPQNSYASIYYSGLKNIKNRDFEGAKQTLNRLLAEFNLEPHQIAVTASTLSYAYQAESERDRANGLLIAAAIADLQSATKETSALAVLADRLYHKGDLENAYSYIRQAMDDANYYGARQRKAQVGNILPIIVSARFKELEARQKVWFIYSAFVTVLTLLILLFAVIIYKELKRRRAAERALQEANKIKEEYIGYYFNIKSEYLGKIEAFKRSIEMKLLTKKLEDIRSIVNGIDLKKERDDLYLSFDKVFLKLFPEFVARFNSLFKDEDKITLKEGQLLNTELRIFALIRMGINDPEKIARILNYSISTIYNYKARTKSRSLVPNEIFEKKVMEIHSL